MVKNADQNGYFLCPDKDLLQNLLEGLETNHNRYGYGACPCRIACGNKQYDADIICPCEYRDADVNEFGMCYCGLFVNKEIHDAPQNMGPIPERRPIEIQDAAGKPVPGYTLNDCPEIFGDDLSRTVSWNTSTDVRKLAGKPVRLKFVMKDSDLYSIQFRKCQGKIF